MTTTPYGKTMALGTLMISLTAAAARRRLALGRAIKLNADYDP